MVSLIAGVLLLVLGLYGLKLWTKADPKQLVELLMRACAYGLMLGAVGMLAMGRVVAAVPMAVIGVALLGRLDPQGVGGWLGGLFKGRTAPKVSRVRAPLLEMELNHATGEMRGQMVAGPFAGAALDDLDLPTLLNFRAGCDPQSLALLEAYLDRRAPAWREHAQGNARGGNAGGAGPDAMTEQKAYEVLGLQPGADEAAIRARHRELMKKVHPDQGGTDDLAARINQAKDVLLRGHR